MLLNLPLLSFLAHIPVPATFEAVYNYRNNISYEDTDQSKWTHKEWAFHAVQAIAVGTLFSTGIAMATPVFHSTFSFIPSPLRHATIGLCHKPIR